MVFAEVALSLSGNADKIEVSCEFGKDINYLVQSRVIKIVIGTSLLDNTE